MAVYKVRIEALSPLHLSSGKADVTLDAEVVHDVYGIPLFPAKRFKGLLYESALEVVEMAELSGRRFLARETVEELFGHAALAQTEADGEPLKLIVHDLHPEGYEALRKDMAYLMRRYKEALRPEDILGEYTSLRFQTEIDKATGTALENSLHNMQVVEADDLVFTGEIELVGAEERHREALALAFANLRSAGLKRNRGFGKIRCTMQDQEELLAAALRKDVG